MRKTAILVLFSALLVSAEAHSLPESAQSSHGPRPSVLRLAQSASPEAVFWQSIRGTSNPAELEAYLRAYPNGQYAPLARKRLEALRPATAGGVQKRSPGTGAPAFREETIAVELGRRAGWTHGVLGVFIRNIPKEWADILGLASPSGIIVVSVQPGGPAERAGIRPMDIIRAYQGQKLVQTPDLLRVMARAAPGDRVTLSVLRAVGGASRLLDWVRGRAAKGHGGAMDLLGWAYSEGAGVEKDLSKAAHWLRKAAEKGSVRAMNDLGVAYAGGRGVPKDLAEAARWYRRAAEAGNADSMNHLGYAYQKGLGVAKELAEAVRWYRKAAERDHAVAMGNLGAMFANGRGVAKDETAAIIWFHKAADRGNAHAMKNLGWMYANGRGVFKNATEGVRWYRKAAARGDPGAMTNFGYAYETGQGVRKDLAEAVRWYRKAAEGGDPFGMTNLGTMYGNGRGVAKDQERAAHWYRKAVEKGNTRAMHSLGAMHDNGEGGVARDREKAAQLVFKALKAGYDFSIKQMTTNATAWSKPFRRALQRLMREAGVYDGSIDGNFGPATKRAVRALAGR